jgi:hypothetical protein
VVAAVAVATAAAVAEAAIVVVVAADRMAVEAADTRTGNSHFRVLSIR